MSKINATLCCLGIAGAFAVAGFSGSASAGWGNRNDNRYQRNDERQGWNNNGYRAPPVVYQNYGAPASTYYAPPLVYGSGVNLNISL
jgi:hypothetical protein